MLQVKLSASETFSRLFELNSELKQPCEIHVNGSQMVTPVKKNDSADCAKVDRLCITPHPLVHKSYVFKNNGLDPNVSSLEQFMLKLEMELSLGIW